MKKIILSTVSYIALTGAAMAADINGEVSVDVTKNSAGDYVATPEIDLAIIGSTSSVAVAFTEDNGNLTLDGYSIATNIGFTTVSFGDQGDVFEAFEGGLETVGGLTLADPDDERESITIARGGAALSIGLTDIATNVSDVENVQASYAFENLGVALGVDYNLDTDDYVIGSMADRTYGQFGVGAITTYSSATETFGYELSASLGGVKGFVDGDDSDAIQNVGAGYTGTYQTMSYYAEAAYNIDDEVLTPAIGVAFAF